MAKDGESEFDDFEMPSDEESPESLPDLSESESLPDLSDLGDDLGDLDEAPVESFDAEPAIGDLGELDAAAAESLAADAEAEEPASQPEVDEVQPAEEKVGPRRAGVQKKLLDRLPADRESVIAVGVSVLLALLWLVGLVYFSSVVYLIAVGVIPYALWKYRDTSSVFTVLLGCALVAIMTAVYCLWREWGSYRFDVKASGIRTTANATRLVDGMVMADVRVTTRSV